MTKTPKAFGFTALLLLILLPGVYISTAAEEPLDDDQELSPITSVDFSDHRWSHRVVLLFAAHDQIDAYVSMRQSLAEESDAIEERDLVVYHLLLEERGDVDGRPITSVAAQELAESFEVDDLDFHVLLIGKDGEVKMRSDEAVEPSDIFDSIDSMPMRQREMDE